MRTLNFCVIHLSVLILSYMAYMIGYTTVIHILMHVNIKGVCCNMRCLEPGNKGLGSVEPR